MISGPNLPYNLTIIGWKGTNGFTPFPSEKKNPRYRVHLLNFAKFNYNNNNWMTVTESRLV